MAAPRSVDRLRLVCDMKVPRFLVSRSVRLEEETIETASGPLKLEWVIPSAVGTTDAKSWRDSVQRVMLYMHGGAYVLCTPGSLRGCTSPIARRLGTPLCVPEYRRPPEVPIRAAVEDGLATYRHLMRAFPKAEILLGGESAGGGLAASMLAELRDSDLPFPVGSMLMSPWTDLGGSGDSSGLQHASLENAARDYLPVTLVSWIAQQARGNSPEHDPFASPVYAGGSLAALPPIFVLWGKDEVLAGQVRRFCEVWAEKGATLRRCEVEGGLHAPVLFSFCHGPSSEAVHELAKFFNELSTDSTLEPGH